DNTYFAYKRRFAHNASSLTLFFLAEDGIRALIVTGVQACALPISSRIVTEAMHNVCMASVTIRDVPDDARDELAARAAITGRSQIGRASCRERVVRAAVDVSMKRAKQRDRELIADLAYER